MMKTVLYLHGFNSSPESMKAGMIGRAFEGRCRYICPQLSVSPAESAKCAFGAVEGTDVTKLTVIGSSLGGFIATHMAEKLGCRAVVLNPVVDPWNIKIIDERPDSADLQIESWRMFRDRYADELNDLSVKKITDPSRYFLIAATGDEMLDYRQMSAHYEGAKRIIVQGSDHGLAETAAYLEDIAAFCGLGD